jgi:protein TonB
VGAKATTAANPIHDWQAAVLQRVQSFERWPEGVPASVTRAAPIVTLAIDRRGKILAAKVIKSSGYDAIDREASSMFTRVATLPPPPPEIPGETITFQLTIEFHQKPL